MSFISKNMKRLSKEIKKRVPSLSKKSKSEGSISAKEGQNKKITKHLKMSAEKFQEDLSQTNGIGPKITYHGVLIQYDVKNPELIRITPLDMTGNAIRGMQDTLVLKEENKKFYKRLVRRIQERENRGMEHTVNASNSSESPRKSDLVPEEQNSINRISEYQVKGNQFLQQDQQSYSKQDVMDNSQPIFYNMLSRYQQQSQQQQIPLQKVAERQTVGILAADGCSDLVPGSPGDTVKLMIGSHNMVNPGEDHKVYNLKEIFMGLVNFERQNWDARYSPNTGVVVTESIYQDGYTKVDSVVPTRVGDGQFFGQAHVLHEQLGLKYQNPGTPFEHTARYRTQPQKNAFQRWGDPVQAYSQNIPLNASPQTSMYATMQQMPEKSYSFKEIPWSKEGKDWAFVGMVGDITYNDPAMGGRHSCCVTSMNGDYDTWHDAAFVARCLQAKGVGGKIEGQFVKLTMDSQGYPKEVEPHILPPLPMQQNYSDVKQQNNPSMAGSIVGNVQEMKAKDAGFVEFKENICIVKGDRGDREYGCSRRDFLVKYAGTCRKAGLEIRNSQNKACNINHVDVEKMPWAIEVIQRGENKFINNVFPLDRALEYKNQELLRSQKGAFGRGK